MTLCFYMLDEYFSQEENAGYGELREKQALPGASVWITPYREAGALW